METPLQDHLPVLPWTDPRLARLPGMLPLDPGDWLRVDEAHAGQMALRDRLIAGHPEAVIAAMPGSEPAVHEVLEAVVTACAALPGYAHGPGAVRRADGVTVPVDRAAPLATLGRLVQEDFCLLEAGPGGEHVLTAAVLCFPAGWTLAEKIGRPLTRIHAPVAPYDATMARRVQRLFDAIRPGAPLWRANALLYADPALHQPRPEGAPRPPPAEPAFVRSERQCLLRLPRTGAVVFSIRTHVVPVAAVPAAALAALRRQRHDGPR
jgi:hypothetical protein